MKSFGLIILLFVCSFQANSQNYSVQEIKTNLKGTVFCPVYWKDDLVVCCDQKDRIFTTVKDKYGNEPVDLFIINPEKPDSSKRFDEIFRTIYHDGPIAFDYNGNQAAISRNLKSDQKYKNLQADENHLGIFFSTIKDGKWMELEAFPHNDTSYNCSHPNLNAAGDVLFFASNMPGGFGGYDIWKSEKKAGIWKKPINLGANINSENDELFPSLDDSFIYFSSNRGVFGGLDIYKYNFNDEYLKVLKEEVNSKYDDFGLISSTQLDSGFFSSNRNGKDEIFKFKFEYPIFENCDPVVETYFCYRLQDDYAIELDNMEGLIYVWNVNGEKLNGVTVDYCFPETGDYEITLDIEDTIIHQTFFEQSYLYISIAYEEQPYINCPDTVQPGQFFNLDANDTYLPSLTIEDDQYYWLLEGSKNFRGKKITYKFDEPGIYEIQLGIIGKEEGNEVQDCAYKTIVCGTVIDSTIIPIDILALTDSVNNQINNIKVEVEKTFYADSKDSSNYFTIELASGPDSTLLDDYMLKLLDGNYEYALKYLPEEDLYIYMTGHYDSVEEAYKAWKDLQLLGLENSILRTIKEETLEFFIDDIFVLKNIQFDSDKWDILPEAIPELKKVIDVLKVGKEFTLEIGAHTDNTASEQYNLSLSNKRAKSIANYIIDAGIDISRIKTAGFGESQPIATNDTEQGKRMNRRVEFKILKN